MKKLRVTRKLTAKEQKSDRRRIKVIKPHFQYRFLGHFVGLSILGIVIANFLLFFYYFIRSGYDVSTQLMYQTSVKGAIHRITLLELLGPAMLASIVISGAISAWIGLRFSHRIAGPLYRFEKTFRDIRHGHRIDSVKLRKYDEFKEVALEMSKTLSWFWRRGKGRK